MVRLFAPPILLAALFACGGSEAPTPPAEPAAAEPVAAEAAKPAEAHGAHGADDTAFQPITAEGAAVSFLAPADGATVTSPMTIQFGATGVTVQAAGQLVPNTGHHHLIINGTTVEAGTVVPADDTHIHYGKGQTEVEVELPPGEHTLTMQLADGIHRSYGPSMSASIRVTVAAPE